MQGYSAARGPLRWIRFHSKTVTYIKVRQVKIPTRIHARPPPQESLIDKSNLRINAPIEYKRTRANHSNGRSYSILTRVAVIDVPTQLTARLTLYDLMDMFTELRLEPPQITVLMGPTKVDDVMSTLALKVPQSLERPTSPASFVLASARSRELRNWG